MDEGQRCLGGRSSRALVIESTWPGEVSRWELRLRVDDGAIHSQGSPGGGAGLGAKRILTAWGC